MLPPRLISSPTAFRRWHPLASSSAWLNVYRGQDLGWRLCCCLSPAVRTHNNNNPPRHKTQPWTLVRTKCTHVKESQLKVWTLFLNYHLICGHEAQHETVPAVLYVFPLYCKTVWVDFFLIYWKAFVYFIVFSLSSVFCQMFFFPSNSAYLLILSRLRFPRGFSAPPLDRRVLKYLQGRGVEG